LFIALGDKYDGWFAEDNNSFYSRFDTHNFRSVTDDIIHSTKTAVKYTLKNKMCEEYSRVRMYGNVLVLMAFPVMF